MNKYLLLIVIAFGTLWSCSDSELITPGDEFVIETEPGTYTVEMNGVVEDFSQITSANSNTTTSNISGANSIGESISILLPNALSVGTFTEVEGARVTILMNDGTSFVNVDEMAELLPLTVVISEVDNSNGLVTGTFYGTVYNATTEEIITLTNGLFFEIEFVPTETTDRILEANFNDELIDFGTDAQAITSASETVISGVNAVENQTLSITIPGEIAIGNYTEADNVVFQVNLASSGSPNDVYTNYDTTTDTYLPVSITISNVTETTDDGRIVGSFSGEIAKFVNGVATDVITVTAGQIDVSIGTP